MKSKFDECGAAATAAFVWSVIGAAFGSIGVGTGVVLLKELCGFHNEKAHGMIRHSFSLLADWVMRVFSLKIDPAVPPTAVALLPTYPFVFTGLSIMSIHWFWQAKTLLQKKNKLAKQLTADRAFINQNEEMWKGMKRSVDALWDKAEYLIKLNKAREDRFYSTLNEIGKLTFHMVMSVDLYMVWIEQHNLLPLNVSASVIMGESTYMAIYSRLNPERSWWRRALRS